MSTITKEQIEQYANAARLIQVSDFDKGKLITVAPDHMLELARIALASLEAEPVAYVDPFAFHNFSAYRAGETDNKRMGREWMWANPDAGLIPVYAVPPAPVSVPDELAGKSFNYIANKFQVSTSEAQWILVGWNARGAAMLNQEKSNG